MINLENRTCWFKIVFVIFLLQISNSKNLTAHELESTVGYLANEAVIYSDGKYKILFDPFFQNSFNTYTLVPQDIRSKIFKNIAPYDNVDFVFVSHAHGDHFHAKDMVRYLRAFPEVKLIAPAQAVTYMQEIEGFEEVKKNIYPVALDFGSSPAKLTFEQLNINATRIPHAGWPSRANIENIVFQVNIEDYFSIVHMGDADANRQHYLPYKKHWQQAPVSVLLPPFWFALSEEGKYISENIFAAQKVINIHVPTRVPEALKRSGADYFSKPGELRKIQHVHSEK